MRDIEEEVTRTYQLIKEVISPVLARIDALLFDLSVRLQDSENVANHGIAELVNDVVLDWAKQLVNPFGMDAPKIVAQQIIRMAFNDEPPPEFWVSELGRIILAADGFPQRGATQSEAAVILGVTRQAVSKALHDGRLKADKHDERRVSRAIMMRYAGIRRRRFALTEEARVPLEELT